MAEVVGKAEVGHIVETGSGEHLRDRPQYGQSV